MSTSLISSSLSVGAHTIKNRIVVPAMADFGMTGQDCMVNDRHIRRYAAYAEGGAGLIIIEACSVTRFAENRGTIVLDSDACLGCRRWQRPQREMERLHWYRSC